MGPTSQAPRVDEARHEALSELEIALDLADRAEAPPPWLTDRLFRNLLVDVSCSTHRTELSIDKLYDPSTLHGRQGIVEFRAFEMPPNERMAAAQMLLVRAMVAAFSRERYVAPLVRWGMLLHDRYMLPHYLWADLQCVIEHLAAAGAALDPAWFEPFVELRFPVAGRVTLDDITLELRPALEPWPVLLARSPPRRGPPATSTPRWSASSSRSTASSRAATGCRSTALSCLSGPPGGRASTSRAFASGRGARRAACTPPSTCTTRCASTWWTPGRGAPSGASPTTRGPGGRAYDAPPLTAFEAAARRAQRFTTEGHLPWPVDPRPPVIDPERPFTLDLRRQRG